MPVTHTWRCLIISIVGMWLSKVKSLVHSHSQLHTRCSGHHQFFKKMADEENEHANKFMEYQNKRGGTIVLMDVKVSGLFAMVRISFKRYDVIVATSATELEITARST